MGMDVYGKRPKSEDGKYFRASVWSWHPLADMLAEFYPDLIGKIEHLHSNDGDGLGARDATALGKRMLADEAKIREYVAAHEAARKALPRRPCEFCNATGVRRDAVGQAHGFTTRVHVVDGVEKVGWCNACDGAGQREHIDASSWMDFDHVMEFARFALASGGFEIN